MWSIISAGLGLVVKFILGLVGQRQQRADQIELGQQQQRNKSLEEEAEARRRVAEAEAKPRGDKAVEDDLEKGRF